MGKARLFTNPFTGEVKDRYEWALSCGDMHPQSWTNRYNRYGPQDERTWGPPIRPGPSRRRYTNKRTGESLTASRWGERLGISTGSFHLRLCRWGPDDPRLFTRNLGGTATPRIYRERRIRRMAEIIAGYKPDPLRFDMSAHFSHLRSDHFPDVTADEFSEAYELATRPTSNKE